MTPAGFVDAPTQPSGTPAADEARGALGVVQISAAGASAGVAAQRFRPGIAIRLVSAFLLVAALPVVAAIVGLLSISAVNQSLEALEHDTLYFGIRDREFRRGARLLARVHADPANFDSAQALLEARREIDAGLALMHRNLEDLVSRGMIEQGGELMLEQRGVEIATTATLQIARQRLDLIAAGSSPARDAAQHAERLLQATQDLQLRLAALRDRHESMIGRLAEIDQSNLATAVDRVDAAQQALQRMALGIVVSAVLCAGAAIAIVWFYVLRNLVRRLEQVSLTIDRLDAGNFSGPYRAEGEDEIAKMVGALERLRSQSVGVREMQAAMQRSERNLAQSNLDRDRFAHAAAHDLRAPLRGIRNIAEFIADDLGEAAAGKTRRQLDIMRGRIERLDELLESLLDYTRAGSTRPEPVRCSLRELMHYSTVHIPQELARIDVQCAAGAVLTWREPLAQVLRQLIDNAIKHNDHQPAQIEIDCRLQRRSLQVRVIDDGPGIEPRYHKSIFHMFQTLQSRDRVEGSGMGLAIARKLVQSYGGRLIVESDPAKGRGSIFLVTWPIDGALSEVG